MPDYKDATWIPNNNFFADTGKKSFVILHGTAGGSSAENIAHYYQTTEGGNEPVSSHYVIGQDGHVVQTVAEKDGAYGNGVVNNPNWTGNPNNYTISIEHVKPSRDNSDALTPEQQAASFALIKDICERNGIGMHDADDNTGITGHFSIDPVDRKDCPGNYPWDALWAYLSGSPQPAPTPNQNQLKAIGDCWASFFRTLNQTTPTIGTGIYQSWVERYQRNGPKDGPPITREYDSVDWSGNHIVVQEFARARCEWKNGTPIWYS